MAPLHEERNTGHAGWKPSPGSRNAVAREKRNVVLRGQDHITAWLVTSVQSDLLSRPRRGPPILRQMQPLINSRCPDFISASVLGEPSASIQKAVPSLVARTPECRTYAPHGCDLSLGPGVPRKREKTTSVDLPWHFAASTGCQDQPPQESSWREQRRSPDV